MNKTLAELCMMQKRFDLKHSVSGKNFYIDINDENLSELEHLLVCLLGELGEFANILKKVVRGDHQLSEVKADLDEELVDTFIYLLKIANQFDVDLEHGFEKKLIKNMSRFEKK